MWLASTIFDGKQAYKTVDTLPYVPNPYTPLYMAVSRAINLWFGNLLMAGRWLSLLSTLATGGVVAWTIVSAASRRAPMLWRAASGAFGGVAALLADSVTHWCSLMRVDMLAVLFMYAGLGVYIVLGKRERWQYVAAILFVLAIFTKQTMLSAPLACVAFGVFTDFRQALRLGAFMVALIALGVWFLNVVTSGGFLTNVIGYNVNRFSWTLAGLQIFNHLRDSIGWVAIAAAAFAGTLRLPIIRKRGRWQWLEARSRSSYTRAILLASLNCIFAAGGMVAVGKVGAVYNHLIAWDISTRLLAGLFLFPLLATWGFRKMAPAIATLAAVLCLGLLLPPALTLILHQSTPPGVTKLEAETLSVVQNTIGPVFSENLALPIRAGKPVEVEPFTVTAITETGRWDERPYVQLFETHYFRLLVIEDVQDRERYSAAVNAAIDRNYIQFREIGQYKLYRPR